MNLAIFILFYAFANDSLLLLGIKWKSIATIKNVITHVNDRHSIGCCCFSRIANAEKHTNTYTIIIDIHSFTSWIDQHIYQIVSRTWQIELPYYYYDYHYCTLAKLTLLCSYLVSGQWECSVCVTSTRIRTAISKDINIDSTATYWAGLVAFPWNLNMINLNFIALWLSHCWHQCKSVFITYWWWYGVWICVGQLHC